MPLAFLSEISFPMKMLAAKAGAWIASNFGIPVFREGFYITIPAGSILIGNPCSGLRSLVSFLAFGSVYAYFSKISNGKKWVLFFFTVPIALFANTMRVAVLILIAKSWGLSAAAPESPFHTASGVLVFIFGTFLLFCIGRLFEWKKSETDTCF